MHLKNHILSSLYGDKNMVFTFLYRYIYLTPSVFLLYTKGATAMHKKCSYYAPLTPL